MSCCVVPVVRGELVCLKSAKKLKIGPKKLIDYVRCIDQVNESQVQRD